MNLEAVVLVLLGVLVLMLAAYFVLETWLLAWERCVPSPLVRTLYRAGADPLRLASRRAAAQIARAELRCATCPAAGACREWLESGTLDTYRSFCPNAALVERLTARRMR